MEDLGGSRPSILHLRAEAVPVGLGRVVQMGDAGLGGRSGWEAPGPGSQVLPMMATRGCERPGSCHCLRGSWGWAARRRPRRVSCSPQDSAPGPNSSALDGRRSTAPLRPHHSASHLRVLTHPSFPALINSTPLLSCFAWCSPKHLCASCFLYSQHLAGALSKVTLEKDVEGHTPSCERL